MLRKTLLICVFSIVSPAVLVVFAALTFMEAPGVSLNLPTPWIGVWERINIGVFLLWVVVLATALWDVREGATAATHPYNRGLSVKAS